MLYVGWSANPVIRGVAKLGRQCAKYLTPRNAEENKLLGFHADHIIAELLFLFWGLGPDRSSYAQESEASERTGFLHRG